MIVIAAALLLAGGGDDFRTSFVSCLKTASTEASRKKLAADGFIDFARTSCAGTEESFKASLITANVAHGMSRKDSASDASGQLSDNYKEWSDKYSAEAPPPAAAAAKPVAPPPTPAGAPAEPK